MKTPLTYSLGGQRWSTYHTPPPRVIGRTKLHLPAVVTQLDKLPLDWCLCLSSLDLYLCHFHSLRSPLKIRLLHEESIDVWKSLRPECLSVSHIFHDFRRDKNFHDYFNQLSSVAHSCPTLCDPMDCSMPGLPVHHQPPEFTQTHVLWVSDAIQPSHPLCHPLLLPPSIFPRIGVFSNESVLWVRWPKYWSFSFGISEFIPMNIQGWLPLGLIGLMSLLSKGLLLLI